MTSETYDQLKRYETPQPGDEHSGRLVSLGYLELSHLNGDTQIFQLTELGRESMQDRAEMVAEKERIQKREKKNQIMHGLMEAAVLIISAVALVLTIIHW